MKLTNAHASILFVLGFGLYRAACGNGYLTAMGTADGNVGFITTISFMLANNAVGMAVCLILLCSAVRKLRVGRTLFGILSYAFLAFDFLVAPSLGYPVLTGGLYGMATGFLSVAWLVLCLESCEHPAVSIMSGFLLSMLIQLILSTYVMDDIVVVTVLLVVSAAIFVALCENASASGEDALLDARRALRRPGIDAELSKVFFPALLCFMVCVFVVGVSNAAAFGSPIESMFGGVNMQVVNLIAAIISAVIVFCSVRVPNPVRAYTMALPVFFLVFSLVPIVGDGLGSGAGAVMVTCYQTIALLFAAFSVQFVRTHKLDYRAMSAICIGSSNLSLLLGLLAGLLLDSVSVAGNVPLAILVAFAAIYPLGLVLFFVTRRLSGAGRGKDAHLAVETVEDADSPDAPAADDGRCGSAAESTAEALVDVEAVIQQRAADIAAEYGLTEREREILTYLARGRTARLIAAELYISENTAWSHIKSIYAKTGMHSKQAILDMFQTTDASAASDASSPAENGSSTVSK